MWIFVGNPWNKPLQWTCILGIWQNFRTLFTHKKWTVNSQLVRNQSRPNVWDFDIIHIWQMLTMRQNENQNTRSQTFLKTFWNFSVDFCPPWPKVWNFFSFNFRYFTRPRTPGSMMWLRHWWGFVGAPSCFASSLNRGCGVVEKNAKTFQTFGHGWKVG